MTAAELMVRARRAGPVADGVVDARVEGGRVALLTGARITAGQRRRALLAGVAVALAGGGLLLVSPWFGVLTAAGVAYSIMAPGRIQPQFLIQVDAESECVVGSNSVPLNAVRAIWGAFETKGWDGFSVVSAVLDDGANVPLLLLLGADERLARAVCGRLGAIAHCPAEYTGPGGAAISCFAPAR